MKSITLKTVEKWQKDLQEFLHKNYMKQADNLLSVEQKDTIAEVDNLFKTELEESGFNLCENDQNKEIIKKCFEKIKECQPVIDVRLDFSTVLAKLKKVTEISSIKIFESSIKTFSSEENIKNILKDTKNISFEKIVSITIFYIYTLAYLEYNFLRTVETSDFQIEIPNNTSFHNIDSSVKLFPKGKPEYDEVKQGKIGDCYLLATLSSIAKTDPEAIRKCFVNEKTFQTDPFALIRLYKVKLERLEKKKELYNKSLGAMERTVAVPGLPVIIKIRKSVVDFGAQGEAIWVKLFEKAYAVYVKQNNFFYDRTLGDVKYSDIEGGRECMIMAAILKRPFNLKEFQDNIVSTGESAQALKTYDKIKNNAGKKPMTVALCGQKNVNADVTVTREENKLGIYRLHAYTVIGVEERELGKMVILRNPHAEVSSGYLRDSSGNYKLEVINKSTKPGTITLTLNDFVKYFDKISFAQKNYDISDISAQENANTEMEDLRNCIITNFKTLELHQKNISKFKKNFELEIDGKVALYQKKLKKLNKIKSKHIDDCIRDGRLFAKEGKISSAFTEISKKIEIIRFSLSETKKILEATNLDLQTLNKRKADTDEFANRAEKLMPELEQIKEEIFALIKNHFSNVEQYYNNFISCAKELYVFKTNSSVKYEDAFTKKNNKCIKSCYEVISNNYVMTSQSKLPGPFGSKYMIVSNHCASTEKVYPLNDKLLNTKELQEFLKIAVNKLSFPPTSLNKKLKFHDLSEFSSK